MYNLLISHSLDGASHSQILQGTEYTTSSVDKISGFGHPGTYPKNPVVFWVNPP